MLFIWFLVGLYSPVKAQIKTTDIKVTIALTDGKQLSGFIKDETLSKMTVGVKFKPSEAGVSTTYTISDFKNIQFENGESYEVLQAFLFRDTIKTKVLGALILKGKASVYEVNHNEDEVYIIDKDGKTYSLQNDQLNSSEGEITKYFFKNILLSVVEDGGITEDDVQRISFNQEDILTIVKKYNSSKNVVSEVFSHKTPTSTFIIAGSSGNFLDKNDIEGLVTVFYRLYYPRISKSTSINIGLQYSYRQRTAYNDFSEKYRPSYSAISIPFLIQQNILNKKIRPFLRGGLSLAYIKADNQDSSVLQVDEGLQQNYGMTILYGVGLEVDLFKGLMFKTDFYKDAPLDHLITAGLAYRWAVK